MARDRLSGQAIGGETPELRVFPVPWRALGSGAIESLIRRVINLRLKGTSIYWTEENAEAVFQLRAAVVSGRWEEILDHMREAMARDRRTDRRWSPQECLADLLAMDERGIGATINELTI